MNNDADKARKLTWIEIAEYYGRELTSAQLKMFARDVESMTPKQLQANWRIWRTSVGNRMPLPKDLLNLGEQDSRQQANLMVSNICRAIDKHGYCNSEAAKNLLSDREWALVEALNGWSYLCQNLGKTYDLQMFRAQARDLAESLIAEGFKNLVEQKQLEASPKAKELIGTLTKNMKGIE